MAEWLNAHAWKVCLGDNSNGGSNPLPSAIQDKDAKKRLFSLYIRRLVESVQGVPIRAISRLLHGLSEMRFLILQAFNEVLILLPFENHFFIIFSNTKKSSVPGMSLSCS